ncbi:ABC transporter permease [Gulosibacter molinativorax]|uniref:ABC transporter permease n=1 Tax=Gulosibacter molinativorax TaxID=256821 RepID=A0ABT7C5E5_9MICO|nr:ABC transporter permease [Gulosibacter molinativorax]MDJ1370415.1 ABC transporter permease [Gulosibacter molinativorax]QUY61328.1 Putative D,D-dipeptide transport system permease protein DdpC [Gulosibacter molinativorax]
MTESIVVTAQAGAPGPSETKPPAAKGVVRGGRLGGIVRNLGLVIALLIIAVVIAWAIWPEAFAKYGPNEPIPDARLLPPSAAHPFGTDNLSQDVFSRMVHGTFTSVTAAALAVLGGFVAGSLIGLLAGYLRGWVDEVLMRIVDVLLAIPSILLSLAIVASLGFGIVNLAIAVGVTSTAAFARVMRSSVLRESEAVYVEAARMSGARWPAVIFRHVLPNSIAPVLAMAALEFGTALLAISALSYLGFGAPPDVPEWGSQVALGRDYIATAWWLTTFPGLVIVTVVLAANVISNRLNRGVRRA